MSDAGIAGLARRCIQALKPYVPGRSIEEVREKYRPPSIVKLGSNENPLGANPRALAAARAALDKAQLYPDGSSLELRRALAARYGLAPENVFCGNGSDEVLLSLAAAFLNPGEQVLVSEHTFSEYEFSGRVFDGAIAKVPLRGMRYDLEGFRARCGADVKLIFLCNPNNPTGTYFTHAELEALLEALPPRALCVVDEAYAEFADAPDFPRCGELRERFPRLVVSRTMSKLHGLAGLRLGYALAHPEVIAEMNRVKTPFNVNLVAQAAAAAAIGDGDWIRRSLEVNREGREFLAGRLAALGLECLPTQANFICFRVPGPAADLAEAMLRRGVIVRALRSFGLEDWIRVTIGTREQNLAFLEALSAVLRPG